MSTETENKLLKICIMLKSTSMILKFALKKNVMWCLLYEPATAL